MRLKPKIEKLRHHMVKQEVGNIKDLEQRLEEAEGFKRIQRRAIARYSHNKKLIRLINQQDITDVVAPNKLEATKVKMKGQFNLRMNLQLPMPIKIKEFAKEPISFHLHKNRHFVRKIELA